MQWALNCRPAGLFQQELERGAWLPQQHVRVVLALMQSDQIAMGCLLSSTPPVLHPVAGLWHMHEYTCMLRSTMLLSSPSMHMPASCHVCTSVLQMASCLCAQAVLRRCQKCKTPGDKSEKNWR